MFKNIAETARAVERARIQNITTLNTDLITATNAYRNCTDRQLATELEATCTRIAHEIVLAERFGSVPLGSLQKIIAHGPVITK